MEILKNTICPNCNTQITKEHFILPSMSVPKMLEYFGLSEKNFYANLVELVFKAKCSCNKEFFVMGTILNSNFKAMNMIAVTKEEVDIINIDPDEEISDDKIAEITTDQKISEEVITTGHLDKEGKICYDPEDSNTNDNYEKLSKIIADFEKLDIENYKELRDFRFKYLGNGKSEKRDVILQDIGNFVDNARKSL